ASSALSTASLTVVRRAFAGLSNPRRWRFLVKKSLTEISRCFSARSTAVRRTTFFAGFAAGAASSFLLRGGPGCFLVSVLSACAMASLSLEPFGVVGLRNPALFERIGDRRESN